MAIVNVIPKEVKKERIDAFVAEEWRACLLTSGFSYVSDGSFVTYADLLADGNEVLNAAGTGYTAGGALVAGKVMAYVGTTNAQLDATNVQWTNASLNSVRFVAVYETTGGLIRAIYDFGADKTVTTGTFTVEWNASGLLKIS